MPELLPVLGHEQGAAERSRRFMAVLGEHGTDVLRRAAVQTLQINVGKLCNQACLHCHVGAGPKRTEQMPAETATRILQLLDRTPEIAAVDITGGAPELNQNFRRMVEHVRRSGRHVIDRCNLTVLSEPGQQDLAAFLADQRVEITASLPCYTRENVDKQRGQGVFERSISALLKLNALGYGDPGTGLVLNLVYNPIGPSLPDAQQVLEADYRRQLRAEFGIEFNALFTITNMPIKRFADDLARSGRTEEYMELLIRSFNPHTVKGLMCRSLVSVGWDGTLYDCDFNQMLEMPVSSARNLWQIAHFGELGWTGIITGEHCFGCTAGAGSSCSGALG